MQLSLSQLLEKAGLSYDDLNSAEFDTAMQWAKTLAGKQLTIEDAKSFITQLIEAVEKDLSDLKESTSFWNWLFHRKRDIYLKARLKNYLVLQELFSGPERARKYIERQLENLKK